MIPDNCWLVVFSRQGMVKRLPLTLFSIQTRGGKGNTLSKLKEGDAVGRIECVTEHSRLLLVSSIGKAYLVELEQFPEMGKYARGRQLSKSMPYLLPGEVITAHYPLGSEQTEGYLTFVTARGIVKKTDLAKFQKIKAAGTKAITLDDGDFVKAVFLSNGSQSIFLGTRNGRAIRFSDSAVRPTGKGARGVRGIKLSEGDEVVGALAGDDSTHVLTASEKGYAKRTKLGLYRQSGRGGQGVTNVKNVEKVGSIKSVISTGPEGRVAAASEMGKLILVEAAGIREAGRGSSGVMLMRLGPGDSLAYVTTV